MQSKYTDEISPEFAIQLLSFRTSMKREIKITTTVRQVADLLTASVCYYIIVVPGCLYFVIIIFLSLPVTVASVKDLFLNLNTLKIIFAIQRPKNVLRDWLYRAY